LVRYVAIIGENVADALVEGDRPGNGTARLHVFAGGGPANTAVALSRLGTPTRFVGRMSEDGLGCLFAERLQQSGVDMSFSVAASEPPTLAIAWVDGAGTATYSFYAEGTADWQWQRHELEQVDLNGAACVHAGSLGLVMAPGGVVVEEFLATARSRATISIDPNVRTALVSPGVYRRRLPTWASVADMVRLSAEDADALSPGVSPQQVFDEWHSGGTSLVILTRGADSTLASFKGTRLEIPTVPVEVVDTIGAGDAFSAAVIHWLYQMGHAGGRLDGLGIEQVHQALSFASKVSALACTVPGADPPSGTRVPIPSYQ
jgi:fructokinase